MDGLVIIPRGGSVIYGEFLSPVVSFMAVITGRLPSQTAAPRIHIYHNVNTPHTDTHTYTNTHTYLQASINRAGLTQCQDILSVGEEAISSRRHVGSASGL